MYDNITKQHKTTWPKLLTWPLIICSVTILAVKCAEPLTFGDLWWHMAIGRHILASGQFIVDHSIFTWTKATPYHVYNAWLSEIILYLIYHITGPIGLIVLRYLIFSGFFAMATYFAIKRDVIANPIVWVIITLGVVLSFIATQIQPELFSFAFMYITVGLYFIIRASGIQSWKLCYLFPLIIMLWVNSHGAFVMSALFFTAVGVGELLNAKFNSPHTMPVKLRLHLFIALGLCLIALMINPFGYHLPLHLLQSSVTIQAEIAQFSANIRGWEPTAIYNIPPYYALDYLIMAMFIYVFLLWQQLKNRQIDWVIILSFLAYCLLFVRMLRTTHFLAPVFVFASLDLLAHKQGSFIWPSSKSAKNIIAIGSIILLGIIGYRTIDGAVCYSHAGTLWSGPIINSQTAVEESEYIRQLPNVNKIGNTYQDGGYLMYQLWPSMRIMVDARYFPFATWIERLLAFDQGYNIEHFLDSHKPDIWVINHRYLPLIDWFSKSKSWIPVFFGPAGVVFTPVSDANIKLKISPNIDQTDSILALTMEFHSALVLKNWPLAERIHSKVASIVKNRIVAKCDQDIILANDLQHAIIGLKAFDSGDYATATANLSRKIELLDFTDIATTAYMLLVQRAWNKNDYTAARTIVIEALKFQPKDVATLYNTAIIDWQYRKFIVTNASPVTDDITWQFLSDIILKHKEKIPQAQVFIINVLTAMKNGSLQEKPPFIIPYTLHSYPLKSIP